MFKAPTTRLGVQAVRRSVCQVNGQVTTRASPPRVAARLARQYTYSRPMASLLPAFRSFQTSSTCRGILPDAEDPPPREAESHEPNITSRTEITDEEYHQHADMFFDELVGRLEKMAESNEAMEVEYSVSRALHGSGGALHGSRYTPIAYLTSSTNEPHLYVSKGSSR